MRVPDPGSRPPRWAMILAWIVAGFLFGPILTGLVLNLLFAGELAALRALVVLAVWVWVARAGYLRSAQ